MNNYIIYDEIHYKSAFKELLVILNYIPKADYEKIPENIIEILKCNADNTYNFKLDLGKSINEQRISELTKAMIENFYRDYWVTDIERKMIVNEEKIKRQEIEEEKKQQFNPDNIFKNKTKQEKQHIENNLPIEVKNNNFFVRLFIIIKKLFIK